MPYLKLRTNASIDNEQSPQLLTGFSQLLAQETGKPERYIMVDLEDGKDMIFSGNNELLAYVECKSIGLSSNQAKSLSASISQILEQQLNIKVDRVYIEFSNCPADFWGWNATTFG